MSDKKPEKSPFAGLLAEKLKSLNLDLKEAPADAKQGSRRPQEQPARADLSAGDALGQPEEEEEEEAAPLSDAELFEQAIGQIAPEDIYRGKFAGQGPRLAPARSPAEREARASLSKEDKARARQADEQADQQAREAVGQAREMRLFEKTVGKVEKLARADKYRRPAMPDPAEDAARRTAPAAYSSEPPDALLTPPLPKSGQGLHEVGAFNPAQRDLHARYKKRARHHEIPEINLRGDSVEDALRQVELFMHQQCKDQRQFVRIIHGRGLKSDGDPVIKPAILHWLEGPGFRYVRGYVPERNSAGDYGSLIVELERKS